jgi:hypothetical protein
MMNASDMPFLISASTRSTCGLVLGATGALAPGGLAGAVAAALAVTSGATFACDVCAREEPATVSAKNNTGIPYFMFPVLPRSYKRDPVVTLLNSAALR